jgi:hypothetical protein
VVGQDVDGASVVEPVDLVHADAETATGADRVIGDETVSGEPVVLSSLGVADAMTEGRRTSQLVLAERLPIP